jgi:hypothetical protein
MIKLFIHDSNILRVYLAHGFSALEVRSEIFEISEPNNR